MVIGLAGNQNCGKTTLFNRLTGAHQHVGNWPGVTVEKKSGALLSCWFQTMEAAPEVVDLPGVYSLAPFSQEEQITRHFLLNEPPDVIINVVDATHLERNLYLTLQLLQLNCPVVLALNMMDELQRNGGRVQVSVLEKELGIPVVPVCARSGQGVDLLIRKALKAAAEQALPPVEQHGTNAAAGRYRYLERVVAACLQAGTGRSHRLDAVLVHSPWAVPILLGCLAFVFLTSFGWPGQALTERFSDLLQWGIDRLSQFLARAGVAAQLCNLLTEGILPGICTVLSFLPPLMLLMFQLNLLEESGYLPRAAFLMDRPLRAIGLSGRSLIPFLMGFGCTVPAALSARGLKNPRERRRTVALIPLMSCGAKLPVYVLLSRAFFPNHAMWVLLSLYLLGILLAVLAGFLAKRFVFPNDEEPFLLELPPYRLPSLGNALWELCQKCRAFLSRTFTVILLATMAVWVLGNHNFALQPVHALADSMLGTAAGWLSQFVRPCGFGNAAAVAALLTGLLAKENIVSTLAVLAGGGVSLAGLQAVFPSGLSAFSFLVFVLLYPPCAAATVTISRELGKPRYGAAVYGAYLLLAWTVSASVYQMGCLLGLG